MFTIAFFNLTLIIVMRCGGNCNKGLSDKLQKLQNRAARILMSAGYDSNLDDLLGTRVAKTLSSKIR